MKKSLKTNRNKSNDFHYTIQVFLHLFLKKNKGQTAWQRYARTFFV